MLWRRRGLKKRGNLPTRPKVSFPFDGGVSAPFKSAFRGSGARLLFQREKRTKGRRPCWHHDAASLPPAARRCLASRPRALLPPKHEFYFQIFEPSPGLGPVGAKGWSRPAGRSLLRWLMAAGSPPPSFRHPAFPRLSLGAREAIPGPRSLQSTAPGILVTGLWGGLRPRGCRAPTVPALALPPSLRPLRPGRGVRLPHRRSQSRSREEPGPGRASRWRRVEDPDLRCSPGLPRPRRARGLALAAQCPALLVLPRKRSQSRPGLRGCPRLPPLPTRLRETHPCLPPVVL